MKSLFYDKHGVFTLLLVLFPKTASATEFFLIGFYFAFLVFVYFAGTNSEVFADKANVFYVYSKALPLVVAFLTGKVFFFFFIRSNSENTEQ